MKYHVGALKITNVCTFWILDFWIRKVNPFKYTKRRRMDFEVVPTEILLLHFIFVIAAF